MLEVYLVFFNCKNIESKCAVLCPPAFTSCLNKIAVGEDQRYMSTLFTSSLIRV